MLFICFLSILATPSGSAAASGITGASNLAVFTWDKVASDGFGNPANVALGDAVRFNGWFYIATRTLPDRPPAQIWRTSDGVGWEQVGKEILASSRSFCFHLVVFRGRLYAVADTTREPEIYVSADGKSFAPLPLQLPPGSPRREGSVCSAFVFKDKLVLAVGGSPERFDLFVSKDGREFQPASFSEVNTPGNIALAVRNPQNPEPVFHNALYAGVTNATHGGEIWRTPDAEHWTRVAEAGLGKKSNVTLSPQLVFGDHLYVVSEPAESLSNLTHFDVFRTVDGTTWEKVVDNGFGASGLENVYGWLTVFRDALYLTTQSLPTPSLVDSLKTGTFFLYRSLDGNTWTQVQSKAFGSPTAFWATMRVIDETALLVIHDTAIGITVLASSDGNSWGPIFSDPKPAQSANVADVLLCDQHLLVVRHDLEEGLRIWRSREPFRLGASPTESVSTTVSATTTASGSGAYPPEPVSRTWPWWLAAIVVVLLGGGILTGLAIKARRQGR
ncbi:MAG: hypothetical protein N3B14_00135 [Thermoleophilia bacterium]|nr:hypothetical protein [Thermoleophilia bacterium]